MEFVLEREAMEDGHGGCYADPDAMVDAWYSQPIEKEKLLGSMNKYGMSEHAVTARAIAIAGDQLERLDRLTIAAERRLEALMRELPRYRPEFIRAAKTMGATIDGKANEVPSS